MGYGELHPPALRSLTWRKARAKETPGSPGLPVAQPVVPPRFSNYERLSRVPIARERGSRSPFFVSPPPPFPKSSFPFAAKLIFCLLIILLFFNFFQAAMASDFTAPPPSLSITKSALVASSMPRHCQQHPFLSVEHSRWWVFYDGCLSCCVEEEWGLEFRVSSSSAAPSSSSTTSLLWVNGNFATTTTCWRKKGEAGSNWREASFWYFHFWWLFSISELFMYSPAVSYLYCQSIFFFFFLFFYIKN